MRHNSNDKGSTSDSTKKTSVAAFKVRLKNALLEVRAIQRGEKQGQSLEEFLGEL